MASDSFEHPKIYHYYGDVVRRFLLVGAALMLVGAPFYADSLQNELLFEIVGAICAVGLAGFTNPQSRWVIVGDAIVSGVVGIIYAVWALLGYESGMFLIFSLRMAVGLVFLGAFYFSMKTVRAMILHTLGKKDSVAEIIAEEEREEKKEVQELEDEQSSEAKELREEEHRHREHMREAPYLEEDLAPEEDEDADDIRLEVDDEGENEVSRE